MAFRGNTIEIAKEVRKRIALGAFVLVAALFVLADVAFAQNAITISIPTAPDPEFAQRYERSKGKLVTDDTRAILRVEVYDAKDGYGIVGEDMIPGRSITIRADTDYQARLRYLREGKSEYPIFVMPHARNDSKVHIAWVLEDGTEHGGNLSGGKTADLRDFWADGWIIEAKK